MEKKKKKKLTPGNVIAWILYVAACLGVGWFIGMIMDTGGLPGLAAGMLFLIIAYFIQTAVHEAGHLVFGLMTGYGFVSYRVGSLMLVRTAEGLKLRRMSLAGTAGQCLLRPPELKEGKIPCFFYNMGGVIMNLILAALCLIPGLMCAGLWREFFVIVSLMGFLMAVLNGVPMRTGSVDNDGKNALSLGKNPAAMRAFWVQMEMNARQCMGERLKDMPEEFFARPEEKDIDNALVSSLLVFRANRLLDAGDYPRAMEEMEALLEIDSLPGLYKSILLCDCATCALLEGDLEKAEAFLEGKEQRRFMKSMRNYISIIRTDYAVARLAKRDEKLAAETMARFEKAARRHPAAADVECERELIAAIDRAYAKKTETANGI